MSSSLKNKLLVGGVLLLVFLCYKLAVQNTLGLKKEYAQLSTKTALLEDTPRQLSILAQKEHYFDSILNTMDLSDTSIQNNLLRVLNEESAKNQVKVIDFNHPHVVASENNSLHTYTFNLQGRYLSILKTVYTLEQNGNFGEVVHLDFEKKKNYKTNRAYLEAKVFIQQVK